MLSAVEEYIGALGDQNDLSHLRTKLGFLAEAFSERISWMPKLEERTWAGIGKISDSSRLFIPVSHVSVASSHSCLSVCVVLVYLSSLVSPSHFPSWCYNFYLKTTLNLQRVKRIVLNPLYSRLSGFTSCLHFPIFGFAILSIFITHLRVRGVCVLSIFTPNT